MKNLSEIINEGIFDKDLVSNNEPVIVQAWCNNFLKISMYQNDPEPIDHIDYKQKKIYLKSAYQEYALINATDQPFTGFIGYDIVNGRGEDITTIQLAGDIRSIDGIPKSITNINFFSDNTKIGDDVWKEINKQFKKLKELEFFVHNFNNPSMRWNGLDLSKLTIPIDKLYIGYIKQGSEVKFNIDEKVGILQFGYGTMYKDNHVKFINLPIIKTLSFKFANFVLIKAMIEGLANKGKSNFKNVVINCRDLNVDEKQSIKSMLCDEETSFKGFGDVLKKIESINSVVNNKDATKDRFGEPLQFGDLVFVAESSNSQWPTKLDIYKGGTSGGRIRTEYNRMIPPRNVIKINNSKILGLIK